MADLVYCMFVNVNRLSSLERAVCLSDDRWLSTNYGVLWSL